MHSGHMGYKFSGIEWDDKERRHIIENWILSKGFQDLARGVRETLEEASFYLDMIEVPSGITTLDEINEKIANFRRRAGNLKFPALLKRVNKRLTAPLEFESEFLSLQRVRNCLEHRGGRVGQQDIEPCNDKMILTFPRLRAFYLRGKEEIEIELGEVIDTHDIDKDVTTQNGVSIYMNRVNRIIEYCLSDEIKISAQQFVEIAMACHMFAADVASKLPTLPPIGNFEQNLGKPKPPPAPPQSLPPAP